MQSVFQRCVQGGRFYVIFSNLHLYYDVNFVFLFQENPCHHPIIILKDVQAQDILNLLSYMYHGEVNVEEDSLPSFIQTAELLQIKGLSTSVTLQVLLYLANLDSHLHAIFLYLKYSL